MKSITLAIVLGLVVLGAAAPTASAEEVPPPEYPECQVTYEGVIDLGIIAVRKPKHVECEL